MDTNQLNEQPPINADADALMGKNARLQHEIKLALQSEAAQVAAAAELKAQIFDMSQQQQRQLDQMSAREDALASAAAREEDLEKQLIRAEREAAEKRDEIFALTSALINLQRDVEVARKKADGLPALMQKLRVLEDQVAELKASTSWRVTMPLRKVKDGLKFLTRS